ncbi:MAG TPA: EamA family transporter [Burkholderiales bacterium]|nr:EamA family transporter [Burkholderiales bacterium]
MANVQKLKPAYRSTALLFLMCVAIWGTTWFAITFQVESVAPEVAVFHRFALASLLLFAWCTLRGMTLRFNASQHIALALQGSLMLGVSYIFVYYAETRIVSGLVAVGFSISPLVNMIGARLAFGTPMSKRVGLGGVLGAIGIAIIFQPELAALRGSGEAAKGIAFTMLAVLTSAAGSLVASRNARRHLPVQPALAWGMLYGAGVNAVLAFVTGKSFALPIDAEYVLSLLYLALFGSVIAFGGYLVLLHRIGAARTGYIGVLVPIVALAVSTAFEGYAWTSRASIGVALCLAGNLLVVGMRRR